LSVLCLFLWFLNSSFLHLSMCHGMEKEGFSCFLFFVSARGATASSKWKRVDKLLL
jgi:hypothetical protein